MFVQGLVIKVNEGADKPEQGFALCNHRATVLER